MGIAATKIDEKKAADKRPACDEIIHFDSDENDIREQYVPRKRLWDDCARLNAAAAEKTSKPSKSPKIQSLLDEIINDSSIKEQSIINDVTGHTLAPTLSLLLETFIS